MQASASKADKGTNIRVRLYLAAHALGETRNARCMCFIVCIFLVVCSFAFGSRALPRLMRTWRPVNPWAELGEIGPASSPLAWQAQRPSVLILAHPKWLGIFAAARAQGPVLGTYFDFNQHQQRSLVQLILSTPSVRTVIVHGIPPGTLSFAKLLKKKKQSIRVVFVYHGTVAQPFHVFEAKLLDEVIEAARNGLIDRIGVVKRGLEDTIRLLGAPNVQWLPNFPSLPSVLRSSRLATQDGKLHIGLAGSSDGVHKNVGTQVMAACGIDDAVLHVTFKPDLPYVHHCKAEIVEMGILQHQEFMMQMSTLDIMLYVSLTEAYPMLVLEAMALGIPTIVSSTHNLLDSDPWVREMLTVAEADSPDAIRAQILRVADNLAALEPRLRAMPLCLRNQAEMAWGEFLQVESIAEATELQLDAFADYLRSGRLASPCSRPAPELPPLSVGKAPEETTIRVAFLTYELWPGTSGGAGVVVSHLAEELLKRGHGVTVIAYASVQAVEAWREHIAARVGGRSSGLIVHHVPTLIDEASLLKSECAPRNVFLQRSGIMAHAARTAYQSTTFDLLEVFDYVGIGYDLMRGAQVTRSMAARAPDVEAGTKTKASSRKSLGLSRAARAKPLAQHGAFLPDHVPLVVRLHGSIELINQAEALSGIEPADVAHDADDETRVMYLMEKYTLHNAHALLAQSKTMAAVYQQAYGLPSENILVAPPPMARILQGIKKVQLPSLAEQLEAGSKEAVVLKILVYGRVARMKGAETVAAAASLIQAGLPSDIKLKLLFAGIDWPCSVHERPTSQDVKEFIVKDELDEGVFEFLGQLDRGHLADVISTVHAGIIASEFESFGLAPHELAAAGLPLVISNIAAFQEFFDSSNSYVFQAGNATCLARAVMELVDDLIDDTARVASLEYDDSIQPYLDYVSAAKQYFQDNHQLSAAGNSRLIDVELGKLTSASPPGCSGQWLP